MNASSARPFVLVNMAITADGKIATANRVVSRFTSAHDHQHLLALRATADAVMAGARTVNLQPINLGPGALKYRRRRLRRGLAEFNLRVVVSGAGRLNPQAAIFQRRFSPVLVLTTEQSSRADRQALEAVADAVKVCGRRAVDLAAALVWLRREWGVRRLLVEGGGELNADLFRQGLVDEVHLTIAPKIFGGHAAPTIADGIGFASLAAVRPFHLISRKRVGDELYLVYGKIMGRSRQNHDEAKS